MLKDFMSRRKNFVIFFGGICTETAEVLSIGKPLTDNQCYMLTPILSVHNLELRLSKNLCEECGELAK